MIVEFLSPDGYLTWYILTGLIMTSETSAMKPRTRRHGDLVSPSIEPNSANETLGNRLCLAISYKILSANSRFQIIAKASKEDRFNVTKRGAYSLNTNDYYYRLEESMQHYSLFRAPIQEELEEANGDPGRTVVEDWTKRLVWLLQD